MLDAKMIRANRHNVQLAAEAKRIAVDLDALLAFYDDVLERANAGRLAARTMTIGDFSVVSRLIDERS